MQLIREVSCNMGQRASEWNRTKWRATHAVQAMEWWWVITASKQNGVGNHRLWGNIGKDSPLFGYAQRRWEEEILCAYVCECTPSSTCDLEIQLTFREKQIHAVRAPSPPQQHTVTTDTCVIDDSSSTSSNPPCLSVFSTYTPTQPCTSIRNTPPHMPSYEGGGGQGHAPQRFFSSSVPLSSCGVRARRELCVSGGTPPSSGGEFTGCGGRAIEIPKRILDDSLDVSHVSQHFCWDNLTTILESEFGKQHRIWTSPPAT
jgi:hypothetical protein